MSINIFGVIGEDVRASDILEKIQAETGDKIEVTIMSPGGSVIEGLAIYDALMANDKEIHTLTMGQACSIASIIFMAGDVREVADNAELMVHNAMVCAGGNKHELSEMVDQLDEIDQKLIDIYTSRTNLSKEEVIALLDKETFMSADEAVNKGFATGKANALALVAIHNKQKEPVNMADVTKEEDKGMLNQFAAFLKNIIKAEGDDIPKKEEEAKAAEHEEEPDLEAENTALKAELSALKAKAQEDDEEKEEMEAKAKADKEAKAEEDDDEKKEEEAKAVAIFTATVEYRITAGEAKNLLSKSPSFVKETLKDKLENATGLGKTEVPKKEFSSKKQIWLAMRNTNAKEAQAYYQINSDDIAKEK